MTDDVIRKHNLHTVEQTDNYTETC